MATPWSWQKKLGLEIIQETPVRVPFEGMVISEYHPDLPVNHAVIAKLKARQALARPSP
jgi:hypothetical protein